MGKRKDMSSDEDTQQDPSILAVTDGSGGGSSHKKHKKHKKKHKRRSREHHEGEILTSPSSGENKPIRLKIMFGGQTMSTKSVPSIDEVSSLPMTTVTTELTEAPQSTDISEEVGDVDVGTPGELPKLPEEDTSDEEREWLDALEAGKLDDYGALPREKNPTLMTARQKALREGKPQDDLIELPMGYLPSPVMTEEQVQRQQQRAKKRKEQAHQKREKDKKLTVERLLKKQDAKLKGSKSRSSRRSDGAWIRYCNSQDMISISVPIGLNSPIQPKFPKLVPTRLMCGVNGCRNLKKYSCSKTGVPLCSLECYKKNLTLQKKSIDTT